MYHTARPELRCVYGKLLAEVYYRLDGAMQGFFRRVKAGEKPGFPRFKPRHQFFTLCYPAMYLEVQDKTIILPTSGGGNWGPKRYQNIVAHLTEEPPNHYHEVAVSKDARGNYYCSFVYDDVEQSKDDDQQKARKRQIRKRMVYNDWGLYGFVQMLEYKCLRFGKDLSLIDKRDTTKMCHVCKHKKDMPLWIWTYRCENCGLVMDRDDNSAVSIYERFLAGPPPHTL